MPRSERERTGSGGHPNPQAGDDLRDPEDRRVAPAAPPPATIDTTQDSGADFEAGSAGISQIDPDEAEPAARRHWERTAAEYQQEHGAFLAAGLVWCPEGLTEAEAGLLGEPERLVGSRVLELGCGAAQGSIWLAGLGANAIGIDLSLGQLTQARQGMRARASLVQATATALPFQSATFDAAFSAYGAVQFVANLSALLAEVQRVLVPNGRWVFAVTHPIRWAFPDEPGPDGLVASGWYFDRTPYVERDGHWRATYAEFHRTLGDYFRALTTAGFRIDDLVEPEWPDWNEQIWGGWSPLRGAHLPGTLILSCTRS